MSRTLLVLLLALFAAPVRAEPPKLVTLDASTLRRLGIATAPATAASNTHDLTGFARVLDPIPLAQLDSDLAAAGATAAASSAEAKRARALFAADATVSRKTAEAATMQARGDMAREMLLRRRLGLEWGPGIARLSGAARAALVSALASGRAALVRIDSPNGAGQAGLRSVRLDLGPVGGAIAVVLGPARAADPRLQSPGLIARVSGPNAARLASGLTVPARLSAASQSGVAVAPGSVIRADGRSWVYVQLAPGRFRRVALVGVTPAASGLFVSVGPHVGDAVVVRGAAALFAAEQGGGDEGD